MKVIVRQEENESGEPQGCVWIVGDDGETRETAYLENGQELPIELTPGEDSYTFGPVASFEQAEEPELEAANSNPSGTLNAPEASIEGPAGTEPPEPYSEEHEGVAEGGAPEEEAEPSGEQQA